MKRRGFLSAASAATLSTVALAGCTDDNGGATDSEDPALKWFPVPEALHEDLPDYKISATAPAIVGEYSDNFNAETWQSYRTKWLDWAAADPKPDDVDRLIIGEGKVNRGTKDVTDLIITIAEHSVERETITGNLEVDGFESTDAYEGFDLYKNEDGSDMRALDDGVLLSARLESGARTILEGLIDSSTGTVDRYYKANESVESVIDTIDTDHYYQFDQYPEITQTNGSSGLFSGSIARGFSNVLDDPEVDMRYVEVFKEGTDVKQAEIDSFIQSAAIFNTSGEVDHHIEGNRLIFEWSTRIDQLNITQLG